MRHHLLSGFLSCALLTVLVAPPSSAKLTLSRSAVVQAKTKLPWLDPSDPYLIYYESWKNLKQSDIDKIRSHFKLVVVPRETTREDVARLKVDNGKPKPLVFGYISIGEDGIKSSASAPPYPGDGCGPCHRETATPQGQNPKPVGGGETVCTKQQECQPSAKDAAASYYLDEYKLKPNCDPDNEECLIPGRDGKPDRNSQDPASGSLFVNTESFAWREIVKCEAQRLLDEVGCDGLFLDTLDMGLRDVYRWTRPSMRSLIFELNQVTPNIMVNRGLFFVEEGEGYSAAEIREYKNHVWGVMFENFYISTEDQNNGDKWRGVAHGKKAQDWLDTYAKRLEGVQVFALDYINCKQSDFKKLADAQRAKVAPLKWRNHITSWLLNEIRYDYKCQ